VFALIATLRLAIDQEPLVDQQNFKYSEAAIITLLGQLVASGRADSPAVALVDGYGWTVKSLASGSSPTVS
jgi:hypothetical protein